MLLSVEALDSYLLMRLDGRILSHNVADPDALSSFMAISGLAIKNIQGNLGFHHFNHLLLKQENKQNLILLKLGSALLGVWQKSNSASSDLLNSLSKIQEQVSLKK